MKRAVLFAVALFLVAADGYRASRAPLAPGADQAAAKTSSFTASGYIEADEAAVTAELGGRILALNAAEGDEVEEGQVLAVLDDSLLRAQLRVAEADLAVAEAALAQVKSAVQPETIARAEAELEQARVAQSAALVAWQDAEAMVADPQEIELALAAVRGQLGVLGFQEQQALAVANSAQAASDLAQRSLQALEEFEPYEEWVLIGRFPPGELPPEVPVPPDWTDGECIIGDYKIVIQDGIVSVYKRVTIKVPADWLAKARQEQVEATYQAWTAWTTLEQARAARRGVESALGQLTRQKSDPLSLEAQANAAESQYGIASAAVGLAEAQVKGLNLGATPEQVGAAESQVEMARAGVGVMQAQLAKMSLRTPISGVVLERPAHVAELAAPGARLMTVGSLDDLTLTVYVPTDRMGQVRIGQPVATTVDAYPGRVFEGRVTLVAAEAEFTPDSITTRDERANMVFAVKIALANPDHALKPGMPADAEFR